MKKVISIFLIATLGLSSCRKEGKEENKEKNKEETISAMLIGVWDAQKELEINYENGVEKDRDEDPVSPGVLVYTFDGTNFSNTYKNFTSTYTYTIKGDIIDYSPEGSVGYIYTIKSVSKTQLVLSEETSNVRNNITYKEVDEFIFIKK